MPCVPGALRFLPIQLIRQARGPAARRKFLNRRLTNTIADCIFSHMAIGTRMYPIYQQATLLAVYYSLWLAPGVDFEPMRARRTR